MKKILIMHQTITGHDAIGNDIECMYKILKENCECACFAENRFNSAVSYVDKEEAMNIINDKESIVIYHHSVNWPLGEVMLDNCKAKLVFRYHNITPPEFFEPYNVDYTHSCTEGRKLTERLIVNFPQALWLSDSVYNTMDLNKVPKEKITVCPPFHKLEEWSKTIPDEEVLKTLLYNKKHNVLFVGRVVPNKGHLFSLDVINAYCRNFGDDIKLYVIGKFDEGLASYNKLVKEKINKYRLEDKREFVGEINDATLMAYYLGCEVFLCTSEHEGFCVPIIEAQRFRLPIVSKESSAVPETIGQNQIVLKDNAKEYAAAIRLLITRKDIRDYLREQGSANLQKRFDYKIVERSFCEFLEKRLGVNL